MSPERLLKIIAGLRSWTSGVRVRWRVRPIRCNLSVFACVRTDAAELKVLYPPENRQPITVVQQQFGGPTSGHISGILTDEYSDDLSVALGSQEG